MLDRLEQSWLDQPYHRYYMQEDLRQTKMEYAQYNLAVTQSQLRPGENSSRTAFCLAQSPYPWPTSPRGFTSTGPSIQEASPSLKSNLHNK